MLRQIGKSLVLFMLCTGILSCGTSSLSGVSNVEALKAFCAFAFGGSLEFLGGSDGLLLRSDDDGENFNRVMTTFDYAIKDMAVSKDGQNGYAVGEMGSFARSEDAGLTWTTSMMGTEDLNSITWATNNEDEGWTVGNKGSIYYTNDKGLNWALQNSGTTEDLNGICISGNQQGFAVGANGTVLGTEDGGQNWQKYDAGLSVSLRYCFRDFNFGIAVGDKGTITQTVTNGVDWTDLNSGTDKDLYDIKLKPDFSGIGLAVGDGVILRTTDFGGTWNTVFAEAQAGFQLFLKRLGWALSGRHVYTVGRTGLGDGFGFGTVPDLVRDGESASSDGLVLESDDDGENWVRVGLKVQF